MYVFYSEQTKGILSGDDVALFMRYAQNPEVMVSVFDCAHIFSFISDNVLSAFKLLRISAFVIKQQHKIVP